LGPYATDSKEDDLLSTPKNNATRARSIISHAEIEAEMPEDQQLMQDAEEVSKFREGLLSLDEVDEVALRRHINGMGPRRAATEMLSYPQETSHASSRWSIRSLLRLINGTRTAAPPRAISSPFTTPLVAFGAVAGAAAILLVTTLHLMDKRGTIGRSNAESSSQRPRSEIAITAPEILVLRWPVRQDGVVTDHESWSSRVIRLPRHLPDYDRSTGSTLGATGANSDLDDSRLSTVIVRSEDGWGSGAIISADGWLLTNYHVVAGAAQAAAVEGKQAKLQVITAHLLDGKPKPNPPVSATLYRADPVHDLALLKLSVTPLLGQVPFFRFANQVNIGDDCFVIGSQNNGPAWWVRSGTILQEFDYPEDLSQFAAGASSAGVGLERNRATVLVTDTRISSGDSGGPLLNAKHELIGLTFATPAIATPANRTAGSVGWHISLEQLRSFTAHLPNSPEEVPFDPWTAGLPEAYVLEPERIAADAVRYSFAESVGEGSVQPVAFTIFADFTGRASVSPRSSQDLFPRGLWGMENRGNFSFNVMLTVRKDNVVAVGYTDQNGILSEIRVGTSDHPEARVTWTRSGSGRWSHYSTASRPLLDQNRLVPGSEIRLKQLLGQFTGRSEPPTHPSLP
jgi:S1-C subfamily serine protease